MKVLNFLKKAFKKKLRKKAVKTAKKKPLKKISKKAKPKLKKPLKKKVKKTLKKPAPKTKKKTSKKPVKKASEQAPKNKEKEIGVITHYFNKISVGIIMLKSELKVGDKIHIKGAHDDFSQTIESMQINRQDISQAKKGDEIGVKVANPVHQNDKVYQLL